MYSVFECPGTLLLIIIIIIIYLFCMVATSRLYVTVSYGSCVVAASDLYSTVSYGGAVQTPELCRRRVPCVRAVGVPSRSKPELYGRPRLAA